MEILNLIFLGLTFLFSVVIHEVSHGLVADYLGDPTARAAGRLTLNPLKHLDPIGSILLPGILFLTSLVSGGGVIFGWTRPVPINSYNFRDRKYGTLKVALAGPLSNFSLALLIGLILRLIRQLSTTPFLEAFTSFLGYITWINLLLFIFNLWPTPPFDGFHILSRILPSFFRKFKSLIYQNFLISSLGAILFMMFIGIPFICQPLFKLLTGIQV